MALGTVGSLASFEAILWVFHARSDLESRAVTVERPPGERRILCVGDSNTYGVYVAPNESYPGRLQSYLERAPDNPWRVINVGFPGFNTAQMRAQLASYLDTYQPEIAIVWGGVNNSWSPLMGHMWDFPDREPEPHEVGNPLRRLLDQSRAYRALRMMVLEGRLMLAEPGGPAPQPIASGAVPARLRQEKGSKPAESVRRGADEVRRSVQIDLRRMHALCAERDVRLAFGSYWSSPSWVDASINASILQVGAELGVPVVGATARMRELVEKYGHERVLTGDDHASGVGNLEVARLMLEMLMEHNFIETREEWRDIRPLEDLLERPTLIRADSMDGALALELIAPPRWAFKLHAELLIDTEGEAEPTSVLFLDKRGARELRRRDPAAQARVAELPRGRLGRFGSSLIPFELPAGLEAAPATLRPIVWRVWAAVRPAHGSDPEDRLTNVLELPVGEIRTGASGQ